MESPAAGHGHGHGPETALPGAARRARAFTPAAETRRLYAGDWAAFAVWCRAEGRTACPAEPGTVTAYLGRLALTHSYGALARRVAAIADQHRRRGMPPPAADAALKALLRDARRGDRRRPSPPTPDAVTRWALACPGDRSGQRDRAILLLLAAGLGRGSIVRLDAEDVHLTSGGMDLDRLPRAEEAPDGRRLSIGRDLRPEACPVRALEDWMRVTGTTFGPVFRKVDRWGNVEYDRLGADAIRRIIERRSREAGRAARGASGRRGVP